jgi:hypothetical protein
MREAELGGCGSVEQLCGKPLFPNAPLMHEDDGVGVKSMW